MSLDRTCHPPIPCRYTAGGNISKDDANKQVPVHLAAVANGKNDFPTVDKQGGTANDNEAVYGELLDVFPETMTCTVQYEGLMYLRALAAYATNGSDNGKAVAMSGTPDQVKPVTAAVVTNAPIIEGGYTENTNEYYYKCRR